MKGNITLTRPYGDDADYIEIQIEDSSSGIHFLSARIGYADFAKLLTGQGYMPCEFELRGIENVGKVTEIKTESVYVPRGDYTSRQQRAETAVAEFEENGWTGRVSNAMNQHNRISGNAEGEWYTVSYYRFVELELDTDDNS